MKRKNLPLAALVGIFQDKGLLTREEADSVKSVALLSVVLEGKVRRLMTPEEEAYLDEVRSVLDRGDFSLLKDMVPPRSLFGFHEAAVQSVPAIERLLERRD